MGKISISSPFKGWRLKLFCAIFQSPARHYPHPPSPDTIVYCAKCGENVFTFACRCHRGLCKKCCNCVHMCMHSASWILQSWCTCVHICMHIALWILKMWCKCVHICMQMSSWILQIWCKQMCAHLHTCVHMFMQMSS